MKRRLQKILKLLGPGFVTGASDDDPSGIATYSQTGALFGYTQLWTALFSFPFTTIVQEMCGRIGIVTGKGIAGVLRKHYPRPLLYVAVCLLFFANTINIGANLGAMAAAAGLIVPIPFIFWLLIITATTLVLEIFLTYQVYARYLKYLTLSLLAYIVTAFIIKQDWSQILYFTFVPHISASKEYLLNIVAVLGTTISPYLFFWQADEEVEEEVLHHRLRSFGVGLPHVTKNDINNMHIDTVVGMFFSNLVMFAIIITSASTLGAHGITNIETASQAAQALQPLAGDFASILFALGIIGIGFLAVPILAGSASYAIAETFRWKAGLHRKISAAYGFYAVITIATLIGLLVNFLGVKPFTMLYYTAVLNGLAAPFLLICILAITNNKAIMGKYTNTIGSNLMGVLITGAMTIAGLFLLASSFF